MKADHGTVRQVAPNGWHLVEAAHPSACTICRHVLNSNGDPRLSLMRGLALAAMNKPIEACKPCCSIYFSESTLAVLEESQ